MEIKSRDDFPKLLSNLGLNGHGAEIGVRYGTFSKLMLERSPCQTWTMVDIWKPLPDDIDATQCTVEECEDWYLRTRKMAAHFGNRARILRMFSAEAAQYIPDRFFDFVYIDAGHTAKAITSDWGLWRWKVRPGGVFAGHDYFNGHVEKKRPVHEEIERENGAIALPLFAVKHVVDSLAGAEGLTVHSTTDDIFNSWWVRV